MDQSVVRIILLGIFLFLLFHKENYTNFVHYDKPFEKPLITCPENYGKNVERLTKQKQEIQPFGYSSNEFIDKIRFIETDQPMPVSPDFFM